ncbi:MAG: electron transfer flavoprotein subunit beta/FixA family protein [Chloroflexota bacterium]|nr:electron transfer flavoprotein subunit beta/FixA family protein [Chloroflexota bacterium]
MAHVLTFTRSTPDTAAKVWVDDEGAVTWGEVATVVNPWDEYSLEETIVQAAHGVGESTVVAIGSALHNDALKHSLAMGIKNALRLEEAGADCNDSLVWSALAAGAIRKLGDVDLIIFGKESVDVGTDQHSYQLARRLGWTMLSYVSRIIDADFAAGKIQAERMLEQGKQTVTAALPAVISVMKGINEPRYPNFLGIRKAAKAQIPVWSAADIEVELPKAATTALRFMNPPARAVSTEIIAGADVKEKAVTLVERLFEEKVL